MKFLVDAQLPPALARVLESHGYVAKHVMDINMHADDDTEIVEPEKLIPFDNKSTNAA